MGNVTNYINLTLKFKYINIWWTELKILIWYALNLLTFALGQGAAFKIWTGSCPWKPKLATKVLLWDSINRMSLQNLLNKSSSQETEGRSHCEEKHYDSSWNIQQGMYLTKKMLSFRTPNDNMLLFNKVALTITGFHKKRGK